MSEAIETAAAAGLSSLAQLVNCLDEHGLATLAGVKLTTLEAWRKRGQGPSYMLLGRNYLYPITAVQAFIGDRLRERTSLDPKGLVM